MKPEEILAIGFGATIFLFLISLTDRSLRANNKKYKKFKKRRFKLTGIETVLFGLPFLIYFEASIFLVSISSTVDNIIFRFILIGVFSLGTIDFFLYLNHVLHEMLQNVSVNSKLKTIEVKRFGNQFTLDLDNPYTTLIIYKPFYPKKYTNRDLQLFGAKFGMVKISNNENTVSVSVLRRFDYRPFLNTMKEENITVVKRQINFIL